MRLRTHFKNHPIQAKLLLLVVASFGTDLVFGTAYKAVKGYAWNDQYQGIEKMYRMPNPVYHHDLAPWTKVDNSIWGTNVYKVRTNSLGFKDRDRRQVKADSESYRLLFMGDSFTEGIGLPYETSFVGLIDDALKDQDIEVLNAGVASYSPIIYWRKLKFLIEEKKLKFDEAVVSIDLSDAYDEIKRYKLSEAGTVEDREARNEPQGLRAKGITWLKNHTMLTYWTLNTLRDAMSKEPARVADSRIDTIHPANERDDEEAVLALNLYLSKWTFDGETYDAYAREAQLRMKESMDKLAALLKKHDVKLTICVYPWPDQIFHRELMSRHEIFWKDWCEAQSVPFISHFPAFLVETEPEKIKQFIREHHFEGDAHWNEAGHRRVADSFLKQWTPPTPKS